MVDIFYKVNANLNGDQVAELFKKSGINRPVDQPDRIQKMIDNSDLIVTAWDNSKLVGIARSLTDFHYCCYLSDLAVDEDYQNCGIETELINRTRAQLTDEVTLVLLSAPSAMTYYPKQGFDKADCAWIIKRKV